ncbi:MAG: hypothetical protein Q4C54_08475 [Clostridia bacterium]|nr:hypothetical protein [Clostridia bacterium]
MPLFFTKLKRAISNQDEYFLSHREEIARLSLTKMKLTSIFVVVVYLLFQVVSLILYHHLDLRLIYLIPIVLLAAFYPVSRCLYRRGMSRYVALQLPCLMQIVTAAFLVLVDTAAAPGYSAVYTPLMIVVAPVLFYLPLRYEVFITAATYGGFLAMMYRFEEARFFESDFFLVTVSFGFSLAVLSMMVNMRYEKTRDVLQL